MNLAEASKKGLKLGVDCCITCGATNNLSPVFQKGLLKEKDDLYCPKHYEECIRWFQEKLRGDE